MTRREEIQQAILENGIDYCEEHPEMNMNLKEAFVMGAVWADKTMTERLHKLKCCYENDLDAEPRVYERDIQLCAKISLIERLIIELKGE